MSTMYLGPPGCPWYTHLVRWSFLRLSKITKEGLMILIGVLDFHPGFRRLSEIFLKTRGPYALVVYLIYQETQLIAEVKKHPELWYIKHERYYNIHAKAKLWELVSAQIGCTNTFLCRGDDMTSAREYCGPFTTKRWTALHIVSMGEQFYDLAKMLFKICDDKHQPLLVDARDRSGHTPLHLALESSSYGKKNVIELLLRHGADPNLTNGWGYTLLHRICMYYRDLRFGAEILFQVCRKINRTVEVNARDKFGNTPLHLALKYAKLNLLELLLRNGADPNSRNTKGLSPLHVTCDDHEYYDLMKMFFELCEQIICEFKSMLKTKWVIVHCISLYHVDASNIPHCCWLKAQIPI
ncbi:unnamed protein product [Trichogramma brassicae]|uniref:MADF domain-containing protein n=1 Tax=Trichogramma brassicae TaxID=86971 RepID=A0A6H5IUP2_9HYME|nr:unnamed protein product [Trichogramma brassicae]